MRISDWSSDVCSSDLDLTQFDAEVAKREAEAFFGPIDILVNNAGISQRSLLVDTSMDVYRRIMELDFFSPVALSQVLLDDMRQPGVGHVVVISSVVGKMGTQLGTEDRRRVGEG